MNNEDEIEKLKKVCKHSYNESRKEAVNSLASYGEDAIPALIDLAEAYSGEHKTMVLKKIQEIRQESKK